MHNNTLVKTIRKKLPGFAEGVIRSDAELGSLKEKIGLSQGSSLGTVKKTLKKLEKGK
jgi:hypothetical protein